MVCSPCKQVHHPRLYVAYFLPPPPINAFPSEESHRRVRRQSVQANPALTVLSLAINIGICFACLAGGYFCGKSAGRSEAMETQMQMMAQQQAQMQPAMVQQYPIPVQQPPPQY